MQKKGKQTKKPPPDKPCHYCSKPGHWVAQCRKKKKDNVNKSPSPNMQNSGGGGTSSLNVVDSSVEVSSSVVSNAAVSWFYDWSAHHTEDWIVDSGASDHMTPHCLDFDDNYTTFHDSTCSAITLGDKKTKLEILGKGTVSRWIDTKTGPRQAKFRNVLHIKGLGRCFIAPTWLHEAGYLVLLRREAAAAAQKI